MTRKQFNETLKRLQRIESELFDLCDWYLECNMIEEFSKTLDERREFSNAIDALFEQSIEY